MPSTFTDFLGLEKAQVGGASNTWGGKLNTNFDLIDEAVNGHIEVTLASAGSSGSPNSFPITDATSSNGRNKDIVFTDGGDLGATAYVQLTPNNAEKVCYITNSLSGSQDLIVFQGNYDSNNDLTIPAGTTVVAVFDGGGTGATVVSRIAISSFISGLLDDASAGAARTTLGLGSSDTPEFAGLTSSGVLSVDDTTDTSSGVTGSIHTDGGLGVAKKGYFGGQITAAGGISIGTSSISGGLGSSLSVGSISVGSGVNGTISSDATAYLNLNGSAICYASAHSFKDGFFEAQGAFSIPNATAPASDSASGFAGQIAWDSGYIYVCTSNNTWKRASLGGGF